jgi:hypothetical protein
MEGKGWGLGFSKEGLSVVTAPWGIQIGWVCSLSGEKMFPC